MLPCIRFYIQSLRNLANGGTEPTCSRGTASRSERFCRRQSWSRWRSPKVDGRWGTSAGRSCSRALYCLQTRLRKRRTNIVSFTVTIKKLWLVLKLSSWHMLNSKRNHMGNSWSMGQPVLVTRGSCGLVVTVRRYNEVGKRVTQVLGDGIDQVCAIERSARALHIRQHLLRCHMSVVIMSGNSKQL